MRNKVWWVMAAAMLCSGCSVLVPYHSKFMCEKTNDYGKCQDVQHAYQEAVGKEAAENAPSKQKDEKTWRYKSTAPASSDGKLRTLAPQGKSGVIQASLRSDVSGQALYRDGMYRELAGLIDQPATPLVRPPQVLRTLIVSYSAADSLYMPRYIYFFAEPAKFVMGEPAQQTGESRTLYPNGVPTAQKR
jgi:conjugal transfer pilus assembly protein TraV